MDLGCETDLLLSSLDEQLAAQEPHTASSRPRDCCQLNICHHWSLQPYQFAADVLLVYVVVELHVPGAADVQVATVDSFQVGCKWMAPAAVP